ncbi:hypothetical protein RDWZM_006667 [Blomia tropicalis]|uniref:DFP2 n=1 Tax=Blomia tropicalis TaxID=40697 RepID=A0A9Q0RNT3_BLOTA|nr:hypothetical protein RDWZM_006667 [Blomia tropicalis]
MASAMTTVLARPLGGYGLSPLIFEPSPTYLLGLASDPVETKVRKSPLFELIMPNYDDDSIDIEPESSETNKSVPKSVTKFDYDSLIASKSNQQQQQQDKTLSSSSTNSYYSTANQNRNLFDFSNNNKKGFNSMFDIGGGSNQRYRDDGYNGKSSKSFNQSPTYGSAGPLNAAIQSVRSVEVKNVQDSYDHQEPQVIDISPSALPIVINFRTSSSLIQVHQTHEPSEPGEVQQTQSEDQPQYLKHLVTKPVIQEVREIIVPMRRVIQEILPVEETIKTIVARGSKEGRSNKSSRNHQNSGYGTKYVSSSGGYASAASASTNTPKKAPKTNGQSGDSNKYKS